MPKRAASCSASAVPMKKAAVGVKFRASSRTPGSAAHAAINFVCNHNRHSLRRVSNPDSNSVTGKLGNLSPPVFQKLNWRQRRT